MLPLSVLGKLRHELVQRLDEARQTLPLSCATHAVAQRMLAAVAEVPAATVCQRYQFCGFYVAH